MYFEWVCQTAERWERAVPSAGLSLLPISGWCPAVWWLNNGDCHLIASTFSSYYCSARPWEITTASLCPFRVCMKHIICLPSPQCEQSNWDTAIIASAVIAISATKGENLILLKKVFIASSSLRLLFLCFLELTNTLQPCNCISEFSDVEYNLLPVSHFTKCKYLHCGLFMQHKRGWTTRGSQVIKFANKSCLIFYGQIPVGHLLDSMYRPKRNNSVMLGSVQMALKWDI